MRTAKYGIWPQIGGSVYCSLLMSPTSLILCVARRSRRDATSPTTPPLSRVQAFGAARWLA